MSRANGAAPKEHHSAGFCQRQSTGMIRLQTSRNIPVIGYWQLGTIPLRPARLRYERHQVSSDPSFRGVLKDVTRERCGSQGTPFCRVLSTTISGHDDCKARNVPVMWLTGIPAGLRSSFRSVLKDVTRERCGSQGTLFRRVLSTTISGHGTTAKLETYQSFAAGGHRSQTEVFLPERI